MRLTVTSQGYKAPQWSPGAASTTVRKETVLEATTVWWLDEEETDDAIVRQGRRDPRSPPPDVDAQKLRLSAASGPLPDPSST